MTQHNRTLILPNVEDLGVVVRDLCVRVEALEAAQQQYLPTTGLHSYKIGKAEPVDDWGKGHTLVNPEPSLKEQALADLQVKRS
jgi:hypothetical protein